METSLTINDMLTPELSLAAQRVGKTLAKLSEAELLAVLGIELQRRGLQQLGVLPKPRVRSPRRAKVEREQLLLLLPVHDDMGDR
ncbi:hypothetical protein QTH97_33675 [Variovorax sp. J22R24]|uniref:hypothetical protein n=1 Tax=Variovorax gracilis TaxID=3053502 RepID=UPI002576EA35|nr:hypothetical protein [Variovorax sp. J22R24]MDM0109903.1 hypothetical protein [Variovorax sp. J22R24]